MTPGLFPGVLVAVLSIAVAGLLATNIATLLSEPVHDGLYGALRSIVGVAGDSVADRLTRNSPKARSANKVAAATGNLKAANEQLAVQNRRIAQEAAQLGQRHEKLLAEHANLQTKRAGDAKKAKEVAGVIRTRFAKAAFRDRAAIPAEAIPYLGIGVILGVAAWDLYDSCQTMKDINELLVRLGEGEEAADFCGMKMPTKAEVVESVRKHWRESIGRAKEHLEDAPAAVKDRLTSIQLPSAREAASLMCPVAPRLCP
jgi:hypothetical protein